MDNAVDNFTLGYDGISTPQKGQSEESSFLAALPFAIPSCWTVREAIRPLRPAPSALGSALILRPMDCQVRVRRAGQAPAPFVDESDANQRHSVGSAGLR